jgi:hypothetical protein
MTEAVPATSSTNAIKLWTSLTDFINQWFHQADLEAFECCLTAVASHHVKTAEPIWPIVVGPSGSGKTVICVMSFKTIEDPKSHLVGDLTPNTFISGRNGNKYSLLHRFGSGVILMKDMTTIMSKRDNDRNEIVSQLREIYDGAFSRQTGNGPSTPWAGKLTLVGAATPAIYRAWSVLRELGERFCFINWPRADDDGVATTVDRQIGHEQEISATMQGLTRSLIATFSPKTILPILSDAQAESLRSLAVIAARARTTVTRDSNGKRDIIEINSPEGIGRLYKSLAVAVRVHAALFNKSVVDDDDVRIGKRIAIDAIPVAKWRFLSCLIGKSDVSQPEIHAWSKIPLGSMDWHADELIATGLIDKAPIDYENRFSLAPDIAERFMKAGLWKQPK